MKPLLAFVFMAVSLLSGAYAQESREYPIRLKILAAQPAWSPEINQVADCAANCYSGEVECRSGGVRVFQTAEASDGKAYDLQCMLDKNAPPEARGCPVLPGVFPARRTKQGFVVLVQARGHFQKQAFSVLRIQKRTEQTSTGEPPVVKVDAQSQTALVRCPK